jgi:hypothetical protein
VQPACIIHLGTTAYGGSSGGGIFNYTPTRYTNSRHSERLPPTTAPAVPSRLPRWKDPGKHRGGIDAGLAAGLDGGLQASPRALGSGFRLPQFQPGGAFCHDRPEE